MKGIPDKCPNNCDYKLKTFYQGCYCSRCPIFNCCGEVKLIEPEDYRDDWREQWEIFFKTGKPPRLYLSKEEERGLNS